VQNNKPKVPLFFYFMTLSQPPVQIKMELMIQEVCDLLQGIVWGFQKEDMHNLRHYSQSLTKMQPRYLSIMCQIFHLKVLTNTRMYSYISNKSTTQMQQFPKFIT